MEPTPLTPLFRTPRKILLAASLALLAAGLSGCGRRGPLELPPEVQAQGKALKAQQEAQAKAVRGKPQPGAAEAPSAPPPPIPGTLGNRPPADYPFPLDPLL